MCLKEEKIPGGLASGKSLKDIANHHEVDINIINLGLKKGIEVESEHTNDPSIAKEIAMGHLWEDPYYYDKLEKVETNEIFSKNWWKTELKEELLNHSFNELKTVGLFDEDSDYGGLIGKSVYELMKVFSKQGHSGFSAQWVRELFNKLANYETLSPLTENDWVDVSEYGVKKDKPLYQSTRNPAAFCTNPKDKTTWYHVDGKPLEEGIKIALKKFLLTEQILPADKRKEILEEFKEFCIEVLSINNKNINILITDDKSKTKTYAHYDPNSNSIVVYFKNRNLGDILRSLAHEFVHVKQNEDGKLKTDSGKTGSNEENQANSIAGIILREFGKIHPEIFE